MSARKSTARQKAWMIILLLSALGLFELFVWSGLSKHSNEFTQTRKIHPNDRVSLIKHGCFLEPIQVSHTSAEDFNAPLLHDSQTAWSILENQCSHVKKPALDRCPIPNAFHLVIAGTMTFKLHHYIALKSIHDIVQPFAIYIHGFEFPLTDSLFKRAIREFNLKLIPSRNVTHVFQTRVHKKEHKSDVLRLETLIQYGGVYADLDVFFLKPLHNWTNFDAGYRGVKQPEDSYLTDHEAVLGVEVEGKKFGNGIILSKRCGRFVMDWYQHYIQFNNQGWGEQSLFLPMNLWQQQYKNSATRNSALYSDELSLQQPDIKNKHLIYDSNPSLPWKFSRNHAVHLWYRSYGAEHTLQSLAELDSAFGRLARYILCGEKSVGFEDDKEYHCVTTHL
ncbi:hypothetical protein BDR26DRAFT_854177 [Obelidium mucronatum]|nr:hypothetical protein BDR26DRAFT_854177 [Obelidium mucronatum]